jgi:hypothetical protein
MHAVSPARVGMNTSGIFNPGLTSFKTRLRCAKMKLNSLATVILLIDIH